MDAPDGRLLYLYGCEDVEFWGLVDLLREYGPPVGHDFDRYREQWKEYRVGGRIGSIRDIERNVSSFDEDTGLSWKIRCFVLYASEFWRRFKNDEWQERTFPDGLPFRKLTWLQFLSLVGWEDLYRGKINGHIELRDKPYGVAHTSDKYASDGGSHRAALGYDAAGYPGLYLPMLGAWYWWEVAPVRLPSSIRYLDTFAHQGGATDSLLLECRLAYESEVKLVYEPVKPPNGYGIEFLSLDGASVPPGADYRELSVSLLFGAADKGI